ncbi:hypothetical protein KCV01_g2231, partial [Aureobasidium melanogenum]
MSASNMPENRPMPARSSSRNRDPRGDARGGSTGTQSHTITSVNNASGMFTVKIACQPNAPVSTPPSTGPTAAVAIPVKDSTPIATRGGALPVRSARSRNRRIAEGYAPDVPMPSMTRTATSQPNDGAQRPAIPASATSSNDTM